MTNELFFFLVKATLLVHPLVPRQKQFSCVLPQQEASHFTELHIEVGHFNRMSDLRWNHPNAAGGFYIHIC